MAVLFSLAFVVLVSPILDAVPADFDEGWFILQARSILRGLRPLVDFPSVDLSAHLYLTAASAKLFGETLAGCRMLSVLSVAASGILVYCLTRPVGGSIPALAAEGLFLSFPGNTRSLTVVPETPMVLFMLLGIYLLFQREQRWAPYAAGVAFVVAIMIRPLCLVVAAVAAVSLALAGDRRRLGRFVASGFATSLLAIGWGIYVTHGILSELVRYQVERFASHGKGMWAIDSGMREMMRAKGIDTPFQQAMSAAREFYDFPRTSLPVGLLVASFLGLIVWLRRTIRSNAAFAIFLVLWPTSYLVLNFVGADFPSPRYFIPYLAFSAVLLGGLVATLASRVGRAAACTVAAVACVVLATELVTIIRRQDAWYFRRAQAIARTYPEVVSFSPIYFAMTRTEPGCGLENPVLTYGSFGDEFLAGPSLRKFAISDDQIIDCLRRNPEVKVLVDVGFYICTRSDSAIRRYLDGEGADRRIFFSRQDRAQWDRAVPSLPLFH